MHAFIGDSGLTVFSKYLLLNIYYKALGRYGLITYCLQQQVSIVVSEQGIRCSCICLLTTDTHYLHPLVGFVISKHKGDPNSAKGGLREVIGTILRD